VVLPFSQVDVFTDEFLLGNPVAVVHDADALTDDQMAAVARWTNLSETTFLITPQDPAADYRLRIFTPARELPFAGHPTLGSARAWLSAGGSPKVEGRLVQECGAGLVRLRHGPGRLAFAAPPLLRDGPVERTDLEQISLGLHVPVEEIVDARWADNGPGWIGVLLADAQTVLDLEPDHGVLSRVGNIGVVGAFPPGSETDYELRAFVSRDGATEDPVTGSLNASVGQWLFATGRVSSSYVASQGTRLGRRGRVYVEQVDGQVWVGGDTVVGVSGSIAL
jgi:PhzF family phenazine biosynthesis protein